MPHDNARLTELELRYMALARTTEELSDVIAEQGRTIAMLLRELREVTSRLKQEPGAPPEQPPHY
jgi:uncharacterized coiled-coil protein SlyX